MDKTNYRPRRSQELYLIEQLKKKGVEGRVTVHHVLEDSPFRLFIQIERWVRGPTKSHIYFERLEI
jgi:hypothetical protein